jgi:hypothetical protein
MSPESGPARKTSAMCDLVNPRDSKYGDAVLASSTTFRGAQGATRTIGHLDRPEDLQADEPYRERREACPARTQYPRRARPVLRRVLAALLGDVEAAEASHVVPTVMRGCPRRLYNIEMSEQRHS